MSAAGNCACVRAQQATWQSGLRTCGHRLVIRGSHVLWTSMSRIRAVPGPPELRPVGRVSVSQIRRKQEWRLRALASPGLASDEAGVSLRQEFRIDGPRRQGRSVLGR